MDRILDQSFWLMCHLARIVPAAGVYASTSMLSFHLSGAEGDVHIAFWLIFVVSAGLLALTSHRTFSGVKLGRIAVALALLSVIRLINEPPSQAESWSVAARLRAVIADYLRNASLVAIILAVGFSAPPKVPNHQDFARLEAHSSRWSQDFPTRSKSWSSRTSRSLSERLIGRHRMLDWLSDVSSVHFKNMGPASRPSSRSSRVSDISLHPEPARIDAIKASLIESHTEIAINGLRGQGLQTVPHDLRELP